MRAALALLAGACALTAAGCGSESADVGARAGDALGYVPAGAAAVVLVSTDLESEQMQALDEALARRLLEEPLEAALRSIAEDLGVSFDRDVRPLLGNDVVIAATNPAGFLAGEDPGIVVAFDAGDPDGLRSLVERIEDVEPAGEAGGARLYDAGDVVLALDGAVLVAAADRQTVLSALEREDGLEEDELADALGDLPADAPLRAFGQLQGYLERPELEPFRGLPWVDALRSFGVAITATEDELRLDAQVATDPDGLSEDDLPLATGSDSPEVLDRRLEVSGANQDQSRTTVFLLRAVRHAFPDSRFVRRVAELEQELGLDFEEEILRQFDGPSVSVVHPDGDRFAARSEVRDPERLREVVGRLGPVLPGLVEALDALRPQGMALLFLIAPDAPVALDELEAVEVEEPATPDGLYRVTGVTGDGPDELWFGLVGDVFVVASSEAEARAIADEPTIEAAGAEGAGVVRADLGELARATIRDSLGLALAVGSVEASTEGLRARLRVELE